MKALTTHLILILIASFLLSEKAFAGHFNLTSDTILSNFGLQNLEFSYRLSDHLTIGLTGASTSRHITNHDIQLNGNSYGTVIRYYIDPAFQNNTWYIGGSAMKTNFEARVISGNTEYVGKSDDVFTLSGGYHWFWKSFNIALGGVFASPTKIELKDAAGNKYSDEFNTNVGVELKIGGMF
jgi:hypothetical protein